MATEKQARLARDEHQDRLAKQGVHGLSVEPVETGAKDSFAVVAWVTQPGRAKLPESLDVKDGDQKLQVPLVVRKSKPFRLE